MQRSAVRLIIHGRVQGVGERAWATQAAQTLRLDGWVRNRADGSVEALVSGTTKAVESFVAAATHGPRGARVTAVDLINSSATWLALPKTVRVSRRGCWRCWPISRSRNSTAVTSDK